MFYQLTTIGEGITAGIFLLAFSALIWFSPKKALIWAVFFLPVYLIKIKLGVVVFTLLDCLLFLLAAGFLVKKRLTEQNFFKEKSYWLLLALLFFSLVASFLAPDTLGALGGFKSFLFLPLLAGIISAGNWRGFSDAKKYFLKPMFFSSGLISLIALVYFWRGALSWDGRLAAFWQSPNQLAMFLGVGFLAGLALLFKGKSSEGKIIIPGLLFMTAVLWLTFSAGAWFSLGTSWLLVFWFWKTANKRFWLVCFAFFYLGLFWLLVGGGQNLLFLGSSFASRLVIWEVAEKIITQHPLAGIGFANFQQFYLSWQANFPPYPEWAVPHAHNLWFDSWLNLGFLGFACWLALWFLLFWGLLRKKNQPRTFLFLGGYLFFVLVYGLVDEPVWRNDLAFVFWLIVGWLILKKKN